MLPIAAVTNADTSKCCQQHPGLVKRDPETSCIEFLSSPFKTFKSGCPAKGETPTQGVKWHTFNRPRSAIVTERPQIFCTRLPEAKHQKYRRTRSWNQDTVNHGGSVLGN
uniref:Uncharacterized protein n=1 Tax=Sphaerodactylus townsendi TaxID=933632 RepID=A0ACB8FY11_9SAUR